MRADGARRPRPYIAPKVDGHLAALTAWPQPPSLGSRQALAPGPLHRPSPQPGSPSSQMPCGSLICFRPPAAPASSRPRPPLGSLLHLQAGPFSRRGCGSRYAPPLSGQADCHLPLEEGPSAGGRRWNACCPWVTWMVVTQLAGAGPSVCMEVPFQPQLPQWSLSPGGRDSGGLLTTSSRGSPVWLPSVSQLGAGQAWLSAHPGPRPLSDPVLVEQGTSLLFPQTQTPKAPRPPLFQAKSACPVPAWLPVMAGLEPRPLRAGLGPLGSQLLRPWHVGAASGAGLCPGPPPPGQ